MKNKKVVIVLTILAVVIVLAGIIFAIKGGKSTEIKNEKDDKAGIIVDQDSWNENTTEEIDPEFSVDMESESVKDNSVDTEAKKKNEENKSDESNSKSDDKSDKNQGVEKSDTDNTDKDSNSGTGNEISDDNIQNDGNVDDSGWTDFY